MDQIGTTHPGRIGDAPAAPSGATPAAAAGFTAAAGAVSGGGGESPAHVIDQTISGSPVAVFSKVICPSSRKAKEILASHLPPGGFTVVELDQRPDGDAVKAELERRTGKHTVPQVFIRGEFLGGADELGELQSSGQLAARLHG